MPSSPGASRPRFRYLRDPSSTGRSILASAGRQQKIEADPPKGTAQVNKWWDILYQMNLLDGALLNETAWSALVGMRKREARDAAKAELAAE